MTQIDAEINLTKYVESCFLQYIQCENLVLGAPSVQIPIQKSVQKLTWKQARKETEISSLNAQKTL